MATTVSKLPEGLKSYCGIPEATFIEDVDTYMTKYIKGGNKIEDKMQDMQQVYGKYKLMEANLLQKKRKLKNQIPEIKTSLEMVKVLKRKRDAKEKMDTHFLLSDLVYSKATVPPTDKVCLWLGANVMLEYTLNDADDLLTKNAESASNSLSEVEHDVNFIRDQITITEVTIARLHNWNVKRAASEKK